MKTAADKTPPAPGYRLATKAERVKLIAAAKELASKGKFDGKVPKLHGLYGVSGWWWVKK